MRVVHVAFIASLHKLGRCLLLASMDFKVFVLLLENATESIKKSLEDYLELAPPLIFLYFTCQDACILGTLDPILCESWCIFVRFWETKHLEIEFLIR